MTLRRVAALLVGLLLANAAQGAVTLGHGPGGRPTLDVTLGGRGPWSVQADEALEALNPAGDLLGDSFPAADVLERDLVAAWLRSIDDTLHVALARDGAWRAVTATVPEPGLGVPLVRCGPDACIVSWRAVARDGAAETHFSRLVVDAAGKPALSDVRILDGWLVDAAIVGSSLHVLLVDTVTADVLDVVLAGAFAGDLTVEPSVSSLSSLFVLCGPPAGSSPLAVTPVPPIDPFEVGCSATAGRSGAADRSEASESVVTPNPPIEPPLAATPNTPYDPWDPPVDLVEPAPPVSPFPPGSAGPGHGHARTVASTILVPGQPIGPLDPWGAGGSPSSSAAPTFEIPDPPEIPPLGSRGAGRSRSDASVIIPDVPDAPLETTGGALSPHAAATLASLALDVHELPGAASEGKVLAWWPAPRELAFVELTEGGPLLPVELLTVEHGPEHPQGLVREALRLVRDRR